MIKTNNLHSGERVKRQSHTSLMILLTLLFGIFTISCEKESDPEIVEDSNEVADEYYVKYEVNSSTIYTGGTLDLTVNTEGDEQMSITVNQNALSETVIGPVEKGFNATMTAVATGETYDHLELYAKIYVSKNDSPFALKNIDDSDENRDSVQLSYTIDY